MRWPSRKQKTGGGLKLLRGLPSLKMMSSKMEITTHFHKVEPMRLGLNSLWLLKNKLIVRLLLTYPEGEAANEDERDKRHQGDVEVWRVDVVSERMEKNARVKAYLGDE